MNALPRQRQVGCAALALLLVATAPVPAKAGEREEMQARLAELARRMGEITRELNGTRDERARELAALRSIELRRADVAERARRIAREVEAGAERVRTLDALVSERRVRFLAERARLARHARAAYAAARRAPLELALGLERPQSMARALALHGRVQHHHGARIRSLETAYRELAELAANLAHESDDLAAARADAARADAALAAEQRERARVVERLNADLADRDAHLASLRADVDRLHQLLRELPAELRELGLEVPEREPFRSLRGKLEWPVTGRVVHGFGTRRGPGLAWQGIFIASPGGREVRAVAGGRVAYADWLRGFGLLVIVEHDDGFMSLYGRNQSLFKEVGDWVEAGEVVATVGDSGGAEGTGLYFEIRRAGKPQDPIVWVRPRRAG